MLYEGGLLLLARQDPSQKSSPIRARSSMRTFGENMLVGEKPRVYGIEVGRMDF